MTEPRLEGFLFTVILPDGTRMETLLQGSGGELGAACLCAANRMSGDEQAGYIQRVLVDILKRARFEAEETGHVRALYPDEPWQTRIRPMAVDTVESVRPIFWPEQNAEPVTCAAHADDDRDPSR